MVAEKCAVTRKAWYIDGPTDRFTGYNNYLDAHNTNSVTKC